MRRSIRWSDAGYTLVELSISVAVAGAISYGVLEYGATLWRQHRERVFVEQMAQLVTSIENMFGAGGTYTGLGLKTAVNLGVFTDEMVDVSAADYTVKHLYGQPLTLGVLSSNGFANVAWGLHYARLPGSACVSILDEATALFDAVAIVPDPAANTTASSFDDWKGKVAITSGVVSGFSDAADATKPGRYRVIKAGRSAKTILVHRDKVGNMDAGMLFDCDEVTARGTESFGLALVRTRQ
jgi:type II secretory pathway pseudopilin PulG